MVRELIVRDGRYTNLWSDRKGESILDMVDARGWINNSQTKKGSMIAKKKAIKIGEKKERLGWRKVAILPHYSYGNPNPYRYEVIAWGGFQEMLPGEELTGGIDY